MTFLVTPATLPSAITATPFVGYYVYPYYSYTYRFGTADLHEFGGYLKYPANSHSGQSEGPWIQPFK